MLLVVTAYLLVQVHVSKEGSCAQYGMIALLPISTGETLFEIPRGLLLTHETSAISQLLDRGTLSDVCIVMLDSNIDVTIILVYLFWQPKAGLIQYTIK